jgi:hypothetical protein
MLKRTSKKPKDINLIAASIVERVAGTSKKSAKKKNPAAVSLGRLGGLKGGRARADKLSPEKRKEIAKKAAQARWSAKKTPQ